MSATSSLQLFRQAADKLSVRCSPGAPPRDQSAACSPSPGREALAAKNDLCMSKSRPVVQHVIQRLPGNGDAKRVMEVKSDRPIRPGSCVWRNITSRSGPYLARQSRMRRSRVRRIPGSSSGWRRISSWRTPTGRTPALFSSIGTTSESKISASGSGRRRPRGAFFCEGSVGSRLIL